VYLYYAFQNYRNRILVIALPQHLVCEPFRLLGSIRWADAPAGPLQHSVVICPVSECHALTIKSFHSH
jgi:hypothetical protein